MSTRDIIAELPRLTETDLRAVEQRILELASPRSPAITQRHLQAERREGRLVLTGPQIVRQSEVEAILDEIP